MMIMTVMMTMTALKVIVIISCSILCVAFPYFTIGHTDMQASHSVQLPLLYLHRTCLILCMVIRRPLIFCMITLEKILSYIWVNIKVLHSHHIQMLNRVSYCVQLWVSGGTASCFLKLGLGWR